MLGPLLWKITYNGVLVLPTPEKATISSIADDLAIIIASKYTVDVYSPYLSGKFGVNLYNRLGFDVGH